MLHSYQQFLEAETTKELRKEASMSQPNRCRSFFFVFVQFLSLSLIMLTGPIIPVNGLLLLVEVLGIGLGVWAVLAMGFGNFNITPDPVREGQLIMRGPYSLIRHPMYLALLLFTSPLVMAEFSIFRALIWIVLLFDLMLKLNYEEGLLVVKLEGYRQYMNKTYRLIPFIF
jgi:protein-S-isoprenylcysteine O-methyltransferase Ste14